MTSSRLCYAGLAATWLAMVSGLIGAHGVGNPVVPIAAVSFLLASWACFAASWRKLTSAKHVD
jgi:hypothetical protein